MLRFAYLFVLASLTAGTAAASTSNASAASASRRGVLPELAVTQSASAELQLFPSATYLLVAATSKNVVVSTTPSSTNYMMTVAGNTLGGALVGVLIGGALYLLQDSDDRRPVNLAWWTGGGALVGVAAGVIQVAVTSNRDSEAVSRRDAVPEDSHKVLAWTQKF